MLIGAPFPRRLRPERVIQAVLLVGDHLEMVVVGIPPRFEIRFRIVLIPRVGRLARNENDVIGFVDEDVAGMAVRVKATLDGGRQRPNLFLVRDQLVARLIGKTEPAHHAPARRKANDLAFFHLLAPDAGPVGRIGAKRLKRRNRVADEPLLLQLRRRGQRGRFRHGRQHRQIPRFHHRHRQRVLIALEEIGLGTEVTRRVL